MHLTLPPIVALDLRHLDTSAGTGFNSRFCQMLRLLPAAGGGLDGHTLYVVGGHAFSVPYSEAVTQPTHRSRSSAVLLAAVPVLMLLMVVIPFTLLREVNAWYGSFLLWTVGTLVVIGINMIVTRQWRD